MKISKFLLLAVFITSLSLLYVYQQTEIFKCAYLGSKKLASLQDLLDKNVLLRYNIEKRSSLALIGDKISEDSAFEMPEACHLIRLSSPQEPMLASRPARNENLFSRILGIKRQAEAGTINR